MISPEEALRRRLAAVPAGHAGWADFEVVCADALTHLLVPPLSAARVQGRTYSGTDRRDAIFPNRNRGKSNAWGLLLAEHDARMVLFEFKNYTDPVGKDEVNQTRNYLTRPMGRLAVIVARNGYEPGAYIKRNTVFSEDNKVIVLLTSDDLTEMLDMKERGEDPADLLVDAIERFYIEYE
jgi:hypothetical protein